MNHQDILTNTITRLTATYSAEEREKARGRLIGALRSIPPDQRAIAAETAIKRLAKQEVLEAKIKALSDEGLDRVEIS